MAALLNMSRLLVETNGTFRWENYGKVWETDHFPFRMKNIDLMCETSIRQTNHFRNMRPRYPHANKCDSFELNSSEEY